MKNKKMQRLIKLAALIAFTAMLWPLTSIAHQPELKPYKISGTINIDTGTIQITYGEGNKGL
ncbi:hypothetical protein [Pedobacter frigidisoli]|uniref:hypothetical protein n=1 Tax=Pedobacter frigidisoli TaxID=2530455 RepID=UPI002931F12F|nr:hypothetical protein [Pedobacter frigidisoli]